MVLSTPDGFSNYNWNTGENTPAITINSSGFYSCAVSDNQGCENTEIIELELYPVPDVNLINQEDVCSRKTGVFLSGGTPSGGYYFGNHISNGYFNINEAGVGMHEIFYTYTNSEGCSNEVSAFIVVNEISGVELYPSPTDGIFSLRINCAKENIEILNYDEIGRQINKRTIDNNKLSMLELSFDLSAQGTGVYYVSINQGNEEPVIKEVVKVTM